MLHKARRPSRLVLSSLLAFALLWLVGCGGGGTPGVYPVRGEVYYRGQPAAGATVIFHPVNIEDPTRIPSAKVEPDGSYRLTTVSANDGAPPGDYTVTITWCDTYRDEGETRDGPDKLWGRYARPGASGLKATVAAGKTSVPRFDLN